MNVNTHQYSFFSKALLVSTIVMIGVIISFFICHSYNQTLSNASKHKLQNLESIAKTLSMQIDGDVHERLTCDYLTKDAIASNNANADYFQIHQFLKQAKELNNIESPIYTLFKNDLCNNEGSENEIFLGVSSSNNPYFRHPYLNSPELLKQNFEKGGNIKDYITDNGHWLSSFYPIRNKDGKTIAVLEVDEDFTTFVAMAKKDLMNDSLYAGLFLLLLSIMFFVVYRYFLSSMTKIKKGLDKEVKLRTAELKESNLSLLGFNEKLENIVQERTKALEVSNYLLSNSNEKLKAFARVASHDLQAPLRSIKGFAQLFKRRYGKVVDEDGIEFLDFITTNSQKMSDLIINILGTSLLPSENTSSITNVDLNNVIKDVEANLKTDIDDKNAEIFYQDLPSILGYRSDFIQLFQNFISNSIKYSRSDVAPKIQIEAKQIEDRFEIKIKDNGKGISDEALKTIFNEFNRGDATDNEGYGIGLATCQRIIKVYEGTLQVSSEIDKGSCFEILLKNKSSKIENHGDAVEASLGMALKN